MSNIAGNTINCWTFSDMCSDCCVTVAKAGITYSLREVANADLPLEDIVSNNLIKLGHRVIFPQGFPCSIVTAKTFHARVRDGSAWFHFAKNTQN